MDELQQQARQKLAEGKYKEAAVLYEQGIEISPEIVSNYWYLGLAQLLQGREEEAQITWMMPMLEASSEEIEQWTEELLTVLNQQANSQEADASYENAWLIRQHYGQIDPNNGNNLLKLLWLSIKTRIFTEKDGIIPQLIEIYSNQQGEGIQSKVILQVVEAAFQLNPFPCSILELVEVVYPYINCEAAIKILLREATNLVYTNYQLGVTITRLCLRLAPDNLDAVLLLSTFCRQLGIEGKWESIELAEQYLDQSQDLISKLIATHVILWNLMEIGGHFNRATAVFSLYKGLMFKLKESINERDRGALSRLMDMGIFIFYFEDSPQTNRPLRNSVARMCQADLQSDLSKEINLDKIRHSKKKKSRAKILKIGYLSNCLRQHSIGWLVRWLLKYHDRNCFEVHLYCPNQSKDWLQQEFILGYGDKFHYLYPPIVNMTNLISQDELDILVDLDSLSCANTLKCMATKVAPLQITWLGYDASGLPAIDYFIADPYVLPDDAQEYYQEKIWRLPSTYIAVDGFEVGVPNLRREQLDIPQEAIIYLSSQTGYKRHPDNIRLQMRILKAVPNSYFLVKAPYTDPESIASFFNQLAEEEGVSSERLRFLPVVAHEAIHRANLTIADVVLDTYPYNGATTTLETLWMGIPMVTRVGKQFAARNSYSMMMNAGIREGIAWTDEEYLEWGVRLGQDEGLRQTIQWKLRQSRHRSPLWNGEKFARQMEHAYQQMWWQYVNDN